jgi:hypothetical protein
MKINKTTEGFAAEFRVARIGVKGRGDKHRITLPCKNLKEARSMAEFDRACRILRAHGWTLTAPPLELQDIQIHASKKS